MHVRALEDKGGWGQLLREELGGTTMNRGTTTRKVKTLEDAKNTNENGLYNTPTNKILFKMEARLPLFWMLTHSLTSVLLETSAV